MGMKLVTRRLLAWIACLAMLFAALAPSMSHAMTSVQGDTWAEICTAGGAKMVKVGAGQDITSGLQTPDALHLEHCPFCATHAGATAPPPSAGFVLPLVVTQAAFPSLYFHAPRPLPVWTAAQSRAPPLHA